MMSLEQRMKTTAMLRKLYETNARLLAAADPSSPAADSIRTAGVELKAELDEWQREVDAVLERRARIGAELAKPLPAQPCRTCGAKATPRTVGNVEDVLAIMRDPDDGIAEVTQELRAFCGSCFGDRLRGLELFAEMRQQGRAS